MNIGQNVIDEIECEIQEALLTGQSEWVTLTADNIFALADGINSFLLERFPNFKVEYIKHLSASTIFVSHKDGSDKDYFIIGISVVNLKEFSARNGVYGQDYSRLLSFRRAHTPHKQST